MGERERREREERGERKERGEGKHREKYRSGEEYFSLNSKSEEALNKAISFTHT